MSFPNIRIIEDALLTVTDNVGHYEAFKRTDQYIVWAEDMESSAQAGNNRKEGQAIEGTIDYFTRTEYDPNVSKIQDALNSKCISFRLNSIQYEDETGYTHYEWVWEVS